MSNKEEQAKLNSNVKSKIHEMNVLQKEMDALVVDRDRAITEHEQTRREYKATKEAFVDFKELMRYKAGVQQQRMHEMRKQQALAHSLTHSITQKQTAEFKERIRVLEEEKLNMLETFNFFMETHGAQLAYGNCVCSHSITIF